MSDKIPLWHRVVFFAPGHLYMEEVGETSKFSVIFPVTSNAVLPVRYAQQRVEFFTFSVHFRCAFSFNVAVNELLVKVTMFVVCLNALSSPFDNLQRLLSAWCVSEFGLMDQAFGVLSRSPVLVFFLPLLPCLTVMFLFRNHNNKNDHSCLHTC